jgi:Arc/MetJ family transcription regulator
LKPTFREQQPSKGSVTENAKNELVKRVRKLRWAGEEEEAEKAQRALGEQTPNDSVLAMPRETD